MPHFDAIAAGVLDNYLKECRRADVGTVFDWASPNSFQLTMDHVPSVKDAAAKKAVHGTSLDAVLPNLTQKDHLYAKNRQLRCHHRFAV